jgi:hypothetical protein
VAAGARHAARDGPEAISGVGVGVGVVGERVHCDSLVVVMDGEPPASARDDLRGAGGVSARGLTS